MIDVNDLIQKLYDWYYYLFPSPPTKESIEMDEKENLVLNKISDEQDAFIKAKKKRINPMLYLYDNLKLCQACQKYRYPENISYMSKPMSPKDDELSFYLFCKDDEGCLVAIKDKTKIRV